MDGTHRIHNYRWPAEGLEAGQAPKGVIAMFHGYGSYVGKFAYLARLFVAQGYDVIGMDMRGFGYSEGTRGIIEDREDFYQEGYTFLQAARKHYSEKLYSGHSLKFFTFGYSQGGALTLGIAKLLHKHGKTPLNGQLYVAPNFGI